jgi:hypothetical protein
MLIFIGWKPKYSNFGEYMVSQISGKPYVLSSLINGKPRPSASKLKEEVIKKEQKKSALWLPGDEDDLL